MLGYLYTSRQFSSKDVMIYIPISGTEIHKVLPTLIPLCHQAKLVSGKCWVFCILVTSKWDVMIYILISATEIHGSSNYPDTTYNWR